MFLDIETTRFRMVDSDMEYMYSWQVFHTKNICMQQEKVKTSASLESDADLEP